jgi:hypothetical protein
MLFFCAPATDLSEAKPRALVASLDVLDYQAGLDAALAKEGLPAPLRRSAVKEARRVVDAMAFRFALMDERPLPEDLDYLRALEAMKRPEEAARVLLHRRGVYAANRRRRLVTTWSILVGLALLVAGFGYAVTSEEAHELALVTHNVGQSVTFPTTRNFTVAEEVTRLHVDGTFLVAKTSPGVIEVRLVDPAGETRLFRSYYAGGNIYLRENVYEPEAGTWMLIVDYLDAQGSVRVSVDGVRPSR